MPCDETVFSQDFNLDLDTEIGAICNSQLDYSFQKEDKLFEDLTCGFDFPLNNGDLDNKLPFDSSLFDSLMDIEVEEKNNSWSDVYSRPLDLYKQEYKSEQTIKSECETPGGSPRSLSSSDSCSSSDFKCTLETPPISPPRVDTSVPLVDYQQNPNPLVQNGKKSTVLRINPNSIKIIPYSANIKGLKTLGKQAQIVLPKEIVEKVEKIKKESELSSHAETIKTPKQPKTVYSSHIPIAPNGAKEISPSITIVPNNAKIITLEPSSQPVTILQGARNIIPSVLPESSRTVRRDDLTMKALKKQQRMIKNRESACLSRKKKKEYVTQLETKLKDMEQENRSLKLENDILKNRIRELESRSFMGVSNSKIGFSNFKKTTTVLAVLFMVSLNIGSISFLQREGIDDELRLDSQGIGNAKGSHLSRTLLWSMPDDPDKTVNTSSKPLTCPFRVNQSESLRLEKELRRWIAVDGVRGREKNVTRKFPHKPSLRQLILHTPTMRSFRNNRVQRRFDNAIELYSPPFPGSLPRRDDTFYVVSFSSDHLLLPAISHNVTLRPKMSLVLPTIPVNDSFPLNETIPMMQIDCEVLATRSVQLTGKDINLLRQIQPSKKGNSSERAVEENHYQPYVVQPKKTSSSEFDQNFDSYVNRLYRAANQFP